MRRILTTSKFERRLKIFSHLHPELTERAGHIMISLASGSFTSFKVHKLKGRLRECHSASITNTYRIVFIIDRNEICFIDIGDHDDVYR